MTSHFRTIASRLERTRSAAARAGRKPPSTWVLGFLGALGALLSTANALPSQGQAGSIRGLVTDKDFDAPLSAAQVQIVETGQVVETTEQGNYVFPEVPPGTYTLVFSKVDYVRHLRSDVVVTAGRLTDVDASLANMFVEMREFVVQDILSVGAGSEAGLLQLRFESPALMDSISSDLIGRAGASDAAGALTLISGASVQDGKYAVIRGLPDRYVSSQLNGVRLPTADEDKRAVELDQFPSVVIESIQVSKTFTPDQQGDASGGAINVGLEGIPDDSIFEVKVSTSVNSQVVGEDDFLTYRGGGVNFWGNNDRSPQLDLLGDDWNGAVGVSTDEAPIDWKFSTAFGGKHELDSGMTIGGFASLFYDRDSSFYDDGVNNSYWQVNPGDRLTPQTNQGAPAPDNSGDYKTALFDLVQGKQGVQLGGLGAVGLETENHALTLSYLYSHTAVDTATLAEDTRGKEFFFPGYDPNDPMGTGNEPGNIRAAPYLRTETLNYTERTTGSLQLHGTHALPYGEFSFGEVFGFGQPELEWTWSNSFADLVEPDKRQFGSLWLAPSFDPGVPPFTGPSTSDPTHIGYKPGAVFSLGNLQRIFKEIGEDSSQISVGLKLPFEQWQGEDGYFKFGWFDDRVDRAFDQDTFSNFNDNSTFQGDFDDFWSEQFPFEDGHVITASDFDVDYDGDLNVSALYSMVDLPITDSLTIIGGARFESTEIEIVNDPEPLAQWFPPGALGPVALDGDEADVSFSQDDILPSIGVVYEATDKLTLRGSYARTIARQTFKELTPIVQQEFLGGPIFIGNPFLEASSLKNYDLRLDYRPYEGALVSASWFYKDIEDPIEYVQSVVGFEFTTPVNYPKGEISGYEIELRQSLDNFWEELDGVSIGANATFIDGRVSLPSEEIAIFSEPGIEAPFRQRDMTNAPEYLYNLYLTYDFERTGTQAALFWSFKGDTLIAGAAESDGNFVPDVYEVGIGTLNLSVSQEISDHLTFKFQAKNITNPDIEEVYRSDFIPGGDVTKTSFSRGAEFSIGFTYVP